MYRRPKRNRLKTVIAAKGVDVPEVMISHPFVADFSVGDTQAVALLATSRLLHRPVETIVAFRIDGYTFAGTFNEDDDGRRLVQVWEQEGCGRIEGEKGIVLLADRTVRHAPSWRRCRLSRAALNLAQTCVREALLEDVRALDDDVLKALMKKVSGRLCTYLLLLEEHEGKGLVAHRTANAWAFQETGDWEAPAIDRAWLARAMMGRTPAVGEKVRDPIDDLAWLDVADVEPMVRREV